MTAKVLTRRQLNRATLERQLLLDRRSITALDLIEHLVGMQGQVPLAPYVGLWSRIESFKTDELGELLTNRQAVRIALLRGTVHLVSADDCLWMRPWLQPLFERYVTMTLKPSDGDVDLPAVVETGRRLVEGQPRTPKQIGELLHRDFPDLPATALALVIRNQLALVQVPPRGVWGRSAQTTLTTAEHWLGQPLEQHPDGGQILLRYLAAYGPSSIKDMQMWCGLTRLREVIEPLRSELMAFRDESGTELFDLPDAPRPDPDVPAPTRFLPEYDNYLRAHDDRGRFLTEAERLMLATVNDSPRPTFIVDGFVGGTWKLDRQRGSVVLRLEQFRTLTAAERRSLTEEADRLLDFIAAGVTDRTIEFAEA